MKISFIGCGNMAGAIIRGIAAKGAVEPENIFAFDTNDEKTQALKSETGINTAQSAKDAAEKADIIFCAVKPNILASVLKEIDGIVCGKKMTQA